MRCQKLGQLKTQLIGAILSWWSSRRGEGSAGLKEKDGEHSEGGVNLRSFRNRPHKRKPIVSVAADMVK